MSRQEERLMLHNKSTRLWLCLGAALLAAGIRSNATAADPKVLTQETREFKISVDGKERGVCKMHIQTRADGSEKMSIDAGLTFDYVIYVYRYHSAGSEIWKEGRLAELENTADLNKTRYRLQARAAKQGVRLTVDGKKQPELPGHVWPTSYWRLPDRFAQKQPTTRSPIVQVAGEESATVELPASVSLLDSDQGRSLQGEIEFVGHEKLKVAGKPRACGHYRISGDVQVELWYDKHQRLVRQEGVESGHKTLLELSQHTTE